MLFKSIFASLVDLFHPHILLLILVPPVVAVVLWIVVCWFFWDSLGQFINYVFLTNVAAQDFLQWLQERIHLGPESVGTFISFVLILLTIFPMAWITALLISSLTATPVVLRHLQKNDFPSMQQKKGGSLWGSVANAGMAGVFFVALWVMTIPLWIVPGVGWLIPLVLTGLLHQRVFWFEVLADHASIEERQRILSENRFELFILGFFLAILITIPFVNLLVPVYGTLVYARYCLSQLQRIRSL